MKIEEAKKKYLENPNICPFCDSDDISAGECDAGDDVVYRDVECYKCNMMWTEIFKLTDIDEYP